MRRKSMLLALLVAVLLVGSAAGGLTLLARHEPEFYRQRAVAPGPERKKHCDEFKHAFSDVLSAVNFGYNFNATISEDQINCYLQESFITSGFAKALLPPDISSPRLAIEPERIRLAFRYGVEPWCSIISIDWRVWLAPKEPNVVVLELKGLHAGSLPISAQSLLEQISDIARRNNIDVTWYRHNGNPVALVRFPNDSRAGVQLCHLELSAGKLAVGGRALENAPRVAVGKPGLAPLAN